MAASDVPFQPSRCDECAGRLVPLRRGDGRYECVQCGRQPSALGGRQ